MLLNHPHRSSSHHFAMQSISWWPNIWPPPPPCATTGIVMHLTTQLFVIPTLNLVVQASISLWMRKQTLPGKKSYFVEEKEVLTWYSLLFVWQTVWTFELSETASSTFIQNVFQFSWTFTFLSGLPINLFVILHQNFLNLFPSKYTTIKSDKDGVCKESRFRNQNFSDKWIFKEQGWKLFTKRQFQNWQRFCSSSQSQLYEKIYTVLPASL